MADKTRILIIDDDEDYRASTRALLEGEGYEVSEAVGGSEGIEAARDQRPDLIVLDIMMESPIEGYTVVHALKHICEQEGVADIPIVMVSSVSEDPASLFPMSGEASLISADAYCTKPIDIPVFLEYVRRMLDQ